MKRALKLFTILAIATLPAAVGTAVTAQNAPGLRLYDQAGFAGTSVRLDRSITDLTSRAFNDQSRSLVADGRWELCIEADYRGECRVVQGQVTDMGSWADKVTSARYLGPSDWGTSGDGAAASIGGTPMPAGARSTPAAATGPAVAQTQPVSQTEVEQAYVYSTVGFGQIRPELVIESLSGTVTGTYAATQNESELDAIYRTGIYGITSGKVDGQMSGNTLSGYWYEPAFNAGLQTACENERNGTFVYGRFNLTFNTARNAFTGLRTSCDITPNPVDHEYETWNGTLVRRQAAAAPNSASRGTVAAQGSQGVSPSGPVDAQGQPLPGAVGRTIRAAGDEVERRTQDRIREGIGRLF